MLEIKNLKQRYSSVGSNTLKHNLNFIGVGHNLRWFHPTTAHLHYVSDYIIEFAELIRYSKKTFYVSLYDRYKFIARLKNCNPGNVIILSKY